MERVNVLVGWGLPLTLMERIATFDPRVHLLNDLHQELSRPPVGPPWPFPDQLLSLVHQADVLLTSRLPPHIWDRAPRLRWVQLVSAGADVAIREGMPPGPIRFTTANGIHAIPISEWVLGAMIALVKQFPQALRAKDRRDYWNFIPDELAGRTAGVLGLGHIGLRVAHLCRALEMRVVGMRRSVTASLEDEGSAHMILPPEELPRLLQEGDFLIICLPRTKETLGLLGERELGQMKRGSYLINVGRGGIVDEEALVHALHNGHLAGAALDVFSQEPLPPESPLWDEPGVLLTAHMAGNTPHYEERATDLFLENLRHYLAGQELLNLYDPQRGY